MKNDISLEQLDTGIKLNLFEEKKQKNINAFATQNVGS